MVPSLRSVPCRFTNPELLVSESNFRIHSVPTLVQKLSKAGHKLSEGFVAPQLTRNQLWGGGHAPSPQRSKHIGSRNANLVDAVLGAWALGMERLAPPPWPRRKFRIGGRGWSRGACPPPLATQNHVSVCGGACPPSPSPVIGSEHDSPFKKVIRFCWCPASSRGHHCVICLQLRRGSAVCRSGQDGSSF